MIPFVERKRPDLESIERLLRDSQESGTWTNFGPLSLHLEATASRMLELPADRTVVACANGTAALHGLVLLEEHLAGRPLRWVVSAFTFHAQGQGPLSGAQVLDCDDHGFLDLEELATLPPASYDGIVVTHLFGGAAPAADYVALARREGKVLIFDSATCFASPGPAAPFGKFGDGEVFSFHHTKPLGFGEGGAAVLPAAREDAFRSLINFGLYKHQPTGHRSFNGKMSDVAAAFILDRWRHHDSIRAGHRAQFDRLAALAREEGLSLLIDGAGAPLPTLAAILFPHAVDSARLTGWPVALHKYYRPLAPRARAERLHARIVCIPCHPGVAALADRELRGMLRALAGDAQE